MRQLRLVGPSEDGTHLVVEAPTGDRFRLPIDERLRAACRGDLSRLGQLEVEREGALRPREIQARVRAGESAEQVAAAAGVALDRVLRFAYPVLQERQRVVAQARTTRVRRGGSTPAETLAELVDERLVGRGTDAASLSWDAWRREDGAWTVQLRWHGTRDYSASWTFDLAARTLHADDPAAEQLIAAEFNVRTITAVTPLAAAARQLAPEPPAAGSGSSAAAGPAPTSGAAALPLPNMPGPGQPDDAADAGADEDERSRRAHVPSWDDILLGVRRRH
jgi:hypothetical protein